MEPYERILESAQKALEHRDRAQDELEYMLDDDAERDPEVERSRACSGRRSTRNLAPTPHLAGPHETAAQTRTRAPVAVYRRHGGRHDGPGPTRT